ncbi:MAG: bifunctional fucokinase/fucose-1-phosphate guanylyltransferase [Bacteroidaceae bacterium]
MKKLLSLPPNLVSCFHEVEHADPREWFCTSDPAGSKLGSGGGTTWLLEEAMRAEQGTDFLAWLSAEKRILLHAGGQSRRLPAYAPSGKILTPIPVYRWGRGQRLTQNLLSLQLPLYEQMMQKAPASLHTMVVSGDILVRANEPLQEIPEADVVCYGLWVDPSLAVNHGVFVMDRACPDRLDRMLQKPSIQTLGDLMQNYFFLMDIGVWLLSDRAVDLLRRRSLREGRVSYYDMYTDFGRSLGANPTLDDSELAALSVAILPLPGGEFYHYGTSREMITSTLAVQNLVLDQREITLHKVKPHPAIFTQNARVEVALTPDHAMLWVENSHVGPKWTLHGCQVITGVPVNDWTLDVPAGCCIDVVPWGETDYVARPYGLMDQFRGALADRETRWMGLPTTAWLEERGLKADDIEGSADLQSARLFPVCASVEELGLVLRWMTNEPDLTEGASLWRKARRLSADEISAGANLRRLVAQRESFQKDNWTALAHNYKQSVFYQLNLQEAAEAYARHALPLPEVLPVGAPLLTRANDAMFRSRVYQLRGQAGEASRMEEQAFGVLREGLCRDGLHRQQPRLSVYADQIVWARSPVRIDLAGGWTDTPPYCLSEGGSVVNIAINLNGQPPLQVYVKPCLRPEIVIRSIDMGASDVVRTFDELMNLRVGSAFSIPKVALALAGFHPDFCQESFASLEAQLQAFGCGIELTMLSAIPAGSGLGTSSILAATALGALNDFCGLGWDKQEIGRRTLVLEQLLTTGGGWQDQYGGLLPGVKLLQTEAGWQQTPTVRWLPEHVFTDPCHKNCHLLYYTGLTRTAKGILAEIVKGMFLNDTEHLECLRRMKQHAWDMYEAIQRNDYERMARLVGVTWQQNQTLDNGTNPPEVQAIIRQVSDLCLGYKLPGAGGGGYLYMAAKDEEAAARIRRILETNRTNGKARFVEMALSEHGMEISRS